MEERMIINERIADIGDFKVGRLLPVRQKRQVGPITFLDHMGPAEIGDGNFMDVDQHPHIGLSTLTYLYEGSVEHRDSLGTNQIVNAGDVGFMTAGKAITHTERTPEHLRDGKIYDAHGYQVWIALPKEKEEMKPEFDFVSREDLPQKQIEGLELTLVAGQGFGMNSPVKVHSPLFIVDALAKDDTVIDLTGQLHGEVAIAVAAGELKSGGDWIKQRQMLIFENSSGIELDIRAGTRVLLLGGEPLPEPRHLLWNFVSSNKERLYQARDEWKARKFPKVPGDNTYVPIPG